MNAGTLAVNGSLVLAVTVNAGATLSGTGSVGGAMISSGGTLSPGSAPGTMHAAGNSLVARLRGPGSVSSSSTNPGTFTVNGALAFQPGSTYQVALNGGTVNVLAASGGYNTQTTYTILNAWGGSGTFADVTSNLAFLTPILDYGPDDVLLELNRNDVSFGSVAVTGNQAALGDALQRASQGTPSSNG